MSCWLVVGSSPSVVEHIQAGLNLADRVITTNGGILLCQSRVPDVYLISDLHAGRLFGPSIRRACARGCRLVRTHYAHPDKLACWSLVADETIHVPGGERWVPGGYVHPWASGGLCLQYAVNAGARRVLMIGMDGYRSAPGHIHVETFDGRRGHSRQAAMTSGRYRVMLQSVIRQSREVEFVQAGRPQYRLVGGHYRLLASLSALSRSAD